MYPAQLPVPTRENYTGGPRLAPKRFKMDDGQYFQKRIGSRNPFKYSLTWKLTWAQQAIHEAWLEYAGNKSSGIIDMPIMGRMVSVTPVTGVCTYTPVGNRWTATLDVEELQERPNFNGSDFYPEWPLELPLFEKTGYSYSKPDAVTMSDSETGKPERRVRFMQRTTQFTATLLLSQQQRDQFWQFHRDYLINGVCWFLAPFVNSQVDSRVRSRIMTQPSEAPNGCMYTLTLGMETVSAPILSRAEYNSIVGV